MRLHIRNGALVGLTTNAAAVSWANVGRLQRDLWEAFNDAGLTSGRGRTSASPSRSRPRAEEADPEEDLWKGLGAQAGGHLHHASDISGPAGPGRGALKAREAYDVTSKPGADPADDGAAEDVKVGEKAKWLTPKDRGSCTLMILDANAVLILENKPADKPAPRSQECRGPLRELAKSFYDAVQTP